jgi:hypothetical protein
MPKGQIGGNNNPTGKGGWVKGQSGNPAGRPKGSVSKDIEYRKILMNSCTYEEWEKIVKRAIRDAICGVAAARSWLSGYLVGLPRQQVEVTGLDGGSLSVDATFARVVDKIYGTDNSESTNDMGGCFSSGRPDGPADHP